MSEEKKDVEVASSTTELVKETGTQATQTVEVANDPAQGEVQHEALGVSTLAAIGDDGVSINNREMEWKRKHDQLADRMPEYIDQAVKEAAKTFQESMVSKQQEPTYTAEQLRMVIHDDTGNYTASNKVWAEQELEKLNESKMAKLLDEKFQLSQRQVQEQKLKAESEAYVIRQFPQMFKKDVNGNVVGWDNNNPMTQLTAEYVKRLGNRPDALREAARQAFVDFELSNRSDNNRKVELAKSEVAKVKKQSIGVGGGNAEVSALQSEVSAAYEKFKNTGSVHDATVYNKLKGRLSAMSLKGK